MFPNPTVQKLHLLICMKPMLSVLHYGQGRIMDLCKFPDGLQRNETITAAV